MYKEKLENKKKIISVLRDEVHIQEDIISDLEQINKNLEQMCKNYEEIIETLKNELKEKSWEKE